MAGHEINGMTTHRCDVCGRPVSTRDGESIATHTLCPQCTLAWQLRRRADWPPQGYVWDGSRWRFDPAAVTKRPFTGYQPTDSEVQWWCFLSWLIATGRLQAGANEGAGEGDQPDSDRSEDSESFAVPRTGRSLRI